MFGSELKKIRKLGVRGCLTQALNLASVAATGLMMYKGLSLLTDSESPVVVVLSGSMEPAFYRGDVLFLTSPAKYEIGDITVYNIPGEDIPIVHRVIESHDMPNDQMLLTKGDNNDRDDIGLYRGSLWLKKSNILGKVSGFLPYVGYGTILVSRLLLLFDSPFFTLRHVLIRRTAVLSFFYLFDVFSPQNDYPQLKFALLGCVGLMSLVTGE